MICNCKMGTKAKITGYDPDTHLVEYMAFSGSAYTVCCGLTDSLFADGGPKELEEALKQTPLKKLGLLSTDGRRLALDGGDT